jgi:hypothetical protein
MSSFMSRTVWILVNAAGIGAFLLLASNFWIEPELADIPGASGGAFVGWFVYAVPIFVFFVLANIFWLAASWTRQRSQRLARTALTCAMLLCWWGAFLLDNAHHGI